MKDEVNGFDGSEAKFSHQIEPDEQVEFDIEELEPGIANPELVDYRVELDRNATFQDLIDKIRFEHGDEAASKVQLEIDWQMQQQDDFTMGTRILEYYSERGYTLGNVQYRLPVIFE